MIIESVILQTLSYGEIKWQIKGVQETRAGPGMQYIIFYIFFPPNMS